MMKRRYTQRSIKELVFAFLIVGLLAGCDAGATTPASGTKDVAQIADAMRKQGVQIANLRPVPIRGIVNQRPIVENGRKVSPVQENQGFDIPGIQLPNIPAGTLRIYKDTKHAKTDQDLFQRLGSPGPTTKLDYLIISGTRELILDHRLPSNIAQDYMDAFGSVP